eukprot:TRINITY_DN44643_c0_g1_i1.p1 TRINITY_DN44643_c0_g1~~TRINITY_DN44643_c0_g1_i1.p1  ORF type:complete len:957 (-),score=98.12 TRINITY_DN44643_c0_g1_i1:140-3010(-)
MPAEQLPDGTQILLETVGDLQGREVAVRIHSECLFGDVLGSLKCDCGPQKDEFRRGIGSTGGVFVYIKGHEGRGTGLLTKVRAYSAVDADPLLHHNAALLSAGAASIDSRLYDAAAELLARLILGEFEQSSDQRDERKTTLAVHTNNAAKLAAIERAIHRRGRSGLSCRQQHVPAGRHCNTHNEKYLNEKARDNGQRGLFDTAESQITRGTVEVQLRNIVMLSGQSEYQGLSLSELLKDTVCCARVVELTRQHLPHLFRTEISGGSDVQESMRKTLDRLSASSAPTLCHSHHVLDLYSTWWDLAGRHWQAFFHQGPFLPDYELARTDVDRFLRRIGVTIDSIPAPDPILLRAVIQGCMTKIPFQNLTMLTRVDIHGRRSPPTLGEIVDDMLEGVGGLCAVRNPFFFLLLKSLGFRQVDFVAGTVYTWSNQERQQELPGVHIALLVKHGTADYWVDIGNGFPYLGPICIQHRHASSVLVHPFMKTRIVPKPGREGVYSVEHASDGITFEENYHFSLQPVDYQTLITSIRRLYNNGEFYGPFLTGLRFNMWSEGGGVILRDNVALSISSIASETTRCDTADDLMCWIRSCGNEVPPAVVQLVCGAWKHWQQNIHPGEEAAEVITVTGGFFDESSNAYVGMVTVWRAGGRVTRLTFRLVKEYIPDRIPVINKGFTGGSWHKGQLWVCWPNRVAVVDPQQGWEIGQCIDDPSFNDLHHVHASTRGILVANTGLETVDRFTPEGELLSRWSLLERQLQLDTDIRDQDAHRRRRGHQQKHANHVGWSEEGCIMATCMKTSDLRIQLEGGGTVKRIELPDNCRPHEGFLARVPEVSTDMLLWNSTVDGRVIATHLETGQVCREWRLAEYPNLSRGWTRGLCLLDDGFLVGTTVLRGEAMRWPDVRWDFDPESSCTGVAFVPYSNSDSPEAGTRTPEVEFLTERNGKIFSLLHTPPEFANYRPS